MHSTAAKLITLACFAELWEEESTTSKSVTVVRFAEQWGEDFVVSTLIMAACRVKQRKEKLA